MGGDGRGWAGRLEGNKEASQCSAGGEGRTHRQGLEKVSWKVDYKPRLEGGAACFSGTSRMEWTYWFQCLPPQRQPKFFKFRDMFYPLLSPTLEELLGAIGMCLGFSQANKELNTQGPRRVRRGENKCL